MTQTDAQLLEAFADVTPTMHAQVGVLTMVATLALLPVAWLGVRRLVPQRNIVFARWGFSHVALALAIFVVLAFAFSLTPWIGRSLALDLVLNAVIFGAVVAAICVWAVRLDPEGVRVLGFRPQGVVRALVAGTLAFVATLPGILGSGRVWMWLLEKFGHIAQPQEVGARFAALPSDQIALPLVLGILVQPLFEEVIFRGFLQPLLVQNFREVLGVGITSLFFAGMHGPDVFLPIFLLSCLLGAVKLRTQSLYAVWFLHALNNAIQLAVLYTYPDSLGGVGGS